MSFITVPFSIPTFWSFLLKQTHFYLCTTIKTRLPRRRYLLKREERGTFLLYSAHFDTICRAERRWEERRGSMQNQDMHWDILSTDRMIYSPPVLGDYWNVSSQKVFASNISHCYLYFPFHHSSFILFIDYKAFSCISSCSKFKHVFMLAFKYLLTLAFNPLTSKKKEYKYSETQIQCY